MKQQFILNPCAAQPSAEVCFIDEKQLLAKLPISRRTLFNWRTTGKIPSVRLGGRRILFHWPSVEAALLRQQKGVGAV
jgi:predicted DNA-binding transcriptional regulator AlpA